jgi:RNA polymerase sigma-70 factor (ECF subfamily)
MYGETRPDPIRLHLLVLRCQAGDEDAFRSLYDEFGTRSLRYLTGLVGNDAADDIQQETWLAVYRRLGSLSEPARFPTWLLSTARNRAIDWLRKRKRERLLLDEGGTEDADAVALNAGSPGPSFEDADVKAALAALPPAHREVLMLRYREELTYAEIALVTGLATGTVRSRLHHARLKLENALRSRNMTDTNLQRRPQ